MSAISSRNIVPLFANSNFARFLLNRAGERATLVAEELRLEQLGRQRGAVHFHERLVAAQRVRAQRPSDKFLACSAFAANEHGDVGVGALVR